MLIGQRATVAYELQVVQATRGWVLGKFVMWLNGVALGDPLDESVDLIGCVSWLRDLSEEPRDRREPAIFGMPKEQAFRRLCDEAFAIQGTGSTSPRVRDAYSRFHISHIGMSSFDAVTLLLIEDQDGRQRCIWRQGQDVIGESFHAPGAIQLAAREAVARSGDLGIPDSSSGKT